MPAAAHQGDTGPVVGRQRVRSDIRRCQFPLKKPGRQAGGGGLGFWNGGHDALEEAAAGRQEFVILAVLEDLGTRGGANAGRHSRQFHLVARGVPRLPSPLRARRRPFRLRSN